jgi:DNA helicase-2/ATP-dependent DNA helicase PcrA
MATSSELRQSASTLTAEDRALIAEEEKLLGQVKQAIAEAPFRDRNNSALRSKLELLREQMQGAQPQDLPAMQNELHELRSLAERRLKAPLPDVRVPYFAHMQIETERGLRDVLLGPRGFIDAPSGTTIVDWRDAPIAQVFFMAREGSEFDAELPGRSIEGVLHKRRILTFNDGALVHLATPEVTLQRNVDGQWQREAGASIPELGGESGTVGRTALGVGRTGHKNPVMASMLDDVQYAAVTGDPKKPMLVLGSAGCGKTTVATHRLAYLVGQSNANAEEMLAIVPEPGLVCLTRSLLAELDLEPVTVMTADDWFAEQGKALFPELPSRRAVNTPAKVMRMKRHAAMASILPDVADRAGRLCAKRLDEEAGAGAEVQDLYAASTAATPLARLEDAVSQRCGGVASEIEAMFGEERKRFEQIDEDREFLLSNEALLRQVIDQSKGELSESCMTKLLMHTRMQLSPTTEEEFAHLPKSRIRTADGRPIDEATPREDVSSIDAEDFPLLLALHQLKTGKAMSIHGKLSRYRHLLIDEAQELSHIELQVLGQALATDASVTIAGDPAQQIDESTRFHGWGTVVDALGVERAEPTILETSYRCTQPIADFGHQVLGDQAPRQAPRSAKQGAPVGRSTFRNEMHATAFLAEALMDLLLREPEAHVGILLRDPERARRLHKALASSIPARLVDAGDFRFEPGVEIATVRQVKGLEFDYVIIPDASDATYPDDSLSRRTLHVAATRAVHQLWVIATGTPSPLLPGA